MVNCKIILSLVLISTTLKLTSAVSIEANRGQHQSKDFEVKTHRSGYYNVSGRSYYVNTETTGQWFAAVQACNARNMRLISLETRQETADIGTLLGSLGMSNSDFWTSLHYIESDWVWTGSGQLLNPAESNWLESEPNQFAGTDCAAGTLHGDHWHDELCTALNWYYICEQ